MGLIQLYTRLSEAQLHEIRMLGAAGDIAEFVGDLREADQSVATDIDKAYPALDLMFDRAPLPVNPISGQGSIPGDIDFGEGIPNYMGVAYVAAARDVVAHITFDTLLDHTTASDLAEQGIGPLIEWTDRDLDYLREKYTMLAEFIKVAAAAHNHVVMELV